MDVLTIATSPELRRAVHDDLPGEVIRLYRTAACLTQAELGALVGFSASTVSRIEHGDAPVHEIATRRHLSAVLRIPGAELGLAAQHWELDHQPGAGMEGEMDRRDLLRGALAAGAVLPLARITDVRHQADQALAYSGASDVTAVQAAAEQHSGGYRGRVPHDVLDDLVDEMARAAPLLQLHHPKLVRVDLARAVGQIGGMAAIVLHDLGRRDEALSWGTTATEAARRSGDRRLRAWVLARKAMVSVNYGAPRLATTIAEQARRAAGRRDSAAAALAASVAARAYAASGQRDAAVAALADADRIAGRLSGTETADDWYGYCAQKHHVHRSHALTLLGDTAAARESQKAGIALTTSAGMTRTLMRLDAAMCTWRSDPLSACEEAAAAYVQAPARYQAGLVRQRAAGVYGRIPEAERRTVQARRLAEVLAG